MASMIKSDFVLGFEKMLADLSVPIPPAVLDLPAAGTGSLAAQSGPPSPVEATADKVDKVVKKPPRQLVLFTFPSGKYPSPKEQSAAAREHLSALTDPKTRVIYTWSTIPGRMHKLPIPEEDQDNERGRIRLVGPQGIETLSRSPMAITSDERRINKIRPSQKAQKLN